MRWQDRISVNPNVCHGKPCIKGTRASMSRHDRGLRNAYNPGSRQNPQRLSDFPRQKTE
jgi:hypothetical protein